MPKDDERDKRWPKLMKFWDSWSKFEKLDEDYKGKQLDWSEPDLKSIDASVDSLISLEKDLMDRVMVDEDEDENPTKHAPKSKSGSLVSTYLPNYCRSLVVVVGGPCF